MNKHKRSRPRRGVKLAIVSSLAVLGAATAPAVLAAPGLPATSLTRTGNQTSGIKAANDGGTWDLRGAVWNENTPDPIDYPVRSESWTRGAILGGEILGNIPRDWTRDQWYNGEGGRDLSGDAFRQTMTDTNDNWLIIRGAHVEDFEDAYDPNAQRSDSTTYLQHVSAAHIRDDCIENEDVPHNMVVTNSLFDGCFTAFAQRPSGSSTSQNGNGSHSFTVEDSLVHVQPQPLGDRYCSSSSVERGRCRPTSDPDVWMGSYGIWKWSDEAAGTVTVRNTVFRLDMPSYSSCSSQRWPKGTYENVTLVWTGEGDYATAGDCENTLPSGVKLTTDVSVWNEAKRAWLNQTASGEPTAEPTAEPTSTPEPSPTEEPSPTADPTPSEDPGAGTAPASVRLVCPVVENPTAGQKITCTYE